MEISSCVELVLITIPLWNLIQVRENTSTDTVIKCFAYVTALSHTACCKELGHRSPKCNRRRSNVAGVFQGPKGITLFPFVLSRPSFFVISLYYSSLESKVQFYILKCNLRPSNVAGVYFQGPKGITLSLFVLSRASFFMLLFLCITVPSY